VSAVDKSLEENILHSDRRTKEQHWEDVNGPGGLLSLMQGDDMAQLREKVLHRWRFKEGPQSVLAEALAAVKAKG
jgi:hypothetical protein